jgi:raffinose/stachyose/melibiose transport system substrate-binding protein
VATAAAEAHIDDSVGWRLAMTGDPNRPGEASPRGRRRLLLIVMAVLAVAAFGQLAARGADSRFALVIGNGRYHHLGPLTQPERDAMALAGTLGGLGFTVKVALDADLPSTRQSLAEFPRDSSGADVALVFYAGRAADVDGEQYLLPVDARASDPLTSALPVSELDAALDASAANLAVLILNTGSGLAGPFDRPVSGPPLHANGKIVLATGSDADRVDDSQGTSRLTTTLLQQFDRPDLDIGAMFSVTRDAVEQLTDGLDVPVLHYDLPRKVYLAVGAPTEISTGAPTGDFDNTRQLENALQLELDDNAVRIENASEREARADYRSRLFVEAGAAPEVPQTTIGAPAEPAVSQEELVWLSISESRDRDDFLRFQSEYPGGELEALASGRLLNLDSAPEIDPSSDPRIASGPPAELAPSEPPLALSRSAYRAVQQLLAALDLYDGGIDGMPGPRTRQGVAAVQAELGRAPTGDLDQTTLRRLVDRAWPEALSGLEGDDRRAQQALAAVAMRGPDAEPERVRIDTLWRHPPLMEYWRQVADGFEDRHPGVSIEFRTEPHATYRYSILDKLGSIDPPDIFYTYGGGYLRALSEAGFARDLSPEMAAGWIYAFKPAALENMMVDGRVFAVPFNITLVSLYANRRLLDSAGIEPAQLSTWQGFLDAIDTLKRAGVTPLAVGGGERWPLLFYWESLAIQLAGRAGVQEALAGQEGGLAGEPFRRAGELTREIARRQPFQPGFLDASSQEAWASFALGEAAMILDGNWAVPTYMLRWPGGAERAVEDIVRVDFPPRDLGYAGDQTYGGVPGWVVRAGAPEVALDFLRDLTGLEAQKTGARMNFDIPTMAGADALLSNPLLSGVASEITASPHHQLGFNLLLGPRTGEVLSNAVLQLIEGDRAPEDVAAEVEAAWASTGRGLPNGTGRSISPLRDPAPAISDGG